VIETAFYFFTLYTVSFSLTNSLDGILMPKVDVLERLDLSLSLMMSPNFVLLRRVKSRLVVASQLKSLDIKVPPLDTLLNISQIYSSGK